jgi:hypothetical protein
MIGGSALAKFKQALNKLLGGIASGIVATQPIS